VNLSAQPGRAIARPKAPSSPCWWTKVDERWLSRVTLPYEASVCGSRRIPALGPLCRHTAGTAAADGFGCCLLAPRLPCSLQCLGLVCTVGVERYHRLHLAYDVLDAKVTTASLPHCHRHYYCLCPLLSLYTFRLSFCLPGGGTSRADISLTRLQLYGASGIQCLRAIALAHAATLAFLTCVSTLISYPVPL